MGRGRRDGGVSSRVDRAPLRVSPSSPSRSECSGRSFRPGDLLSACGAWSLLELNGLLGLRSLLTFHPLNQDGRPQSDSVHSTPYAGHGQPGLPSPSRRRVTARPPPRPAPRGRELCRAGRRPRVGSGPSGCACPTTGIWTGARDDARYTPGGDGSVYLCVSVCLTSHHSDRRGTWD